MLAGSVVLDLEDTGSRMSRLGKGELLYERPLTVDELLARVDRVELAQVQEVAEELLSQPRSLVAVGPLDELFARNRAWAEGVARPAWLSQSDPWLRVDGSGACDPRRSAELFWNQSRSRSPAGA